MYDRTFLYKLVQAKMPFGQYKGWKISSLPIHYLEWFHREGFQAVHWGSSLPPCMRLKPMDWITFWTRSKKRWTDIQIIF